MADEYIRKQDAIRLAEQGQVQGFPWQFQMLVRLPPADVVSVVRCWDCRHVRKWRSEESAKKFGQVYECVKHTIPCPNPNDYCSCGERREE